MRYLFLIGIMLWCVTQVIFDYSLIKHETNASIFYYGGMYLAFALMTANEILRSRNKYITVVYGSIALYFIYDIVYSLKFINKPYELYEKAYINQIPSYEFTIYLSIAMILIHTIFRKWAKY